MKAIHYKSDFYAGLGEKLEIHQNPCKGLKQLSENWYSKPDMKTVLLQTPAVALSR